MVEVWKENLRESLDDFKAKLAEEPLFVAVDTEFTGLRTASDTKNRYWDIPQVRYTQARESANAYTLIQLGMAVFLQPLPNVENGPIRVYVYTLNLFPSTKFRNSFDYNFRCQTRSLEFLAKNGFDFNRLFTDAVPYMTQEDEKMLEHRQQNMRKRKESRKEERAKNKNRVEVIRNRDKEFVEDLKTKLTVFVKELETNPDATLELEVRGGFHRLLVYDTINFDFPIVRYQKLRRPETQAQYIRLSKLVMDRAEGKEEDEKARDLEKSKLLWDQKGMNWFVEALSKSGVPIVVHNGLLDLLHIYSTTRGRLREKFEDFAMDFRTLFPLFYDTKVLASMEGIVEETDGRNLAALKELTDKWDGSPLQIVGTENCKQHHAGYDALLTGEILLKFLYKLGIPISRDWASTDLVMAYENRSPLFKSPVNLAFNDEDQLNWRDTFRSVVVLRCQSFIQQGDLESRFKIGMLNEDEVRCTYRPNRENELFPHDVLVKFPSKYSIEYIIDLTKTLCKPIHDVQEACLFLDEIDGENPFWLRNKIHKTPTNLLSLPQKHPRSTEDEGEANQPEKKIRKSL